MLTTSRLITTAAVFGALTFTVAACGDDDSSGESSTSAGSTAAQSGGSLSGTISGAGASSQAAAQEAWIAGFQTQNPDVTISYDPVGSGGGREQFVAGGIAFGGTDTALEGEELAGAQERCGGKDNLVEVPVYVSPIAVVYNLPGVEGLQLSPETLAKIFKQEITTWDDPAIAADNPGAELPDSEITVVNRSDESGTTENFQQYLQAVAPDVWDFEVDGNWPVEGGEAAQGTSGVIDAVTNGEGTIGYADESQAGDLGVAKIKIGDEYVAPSAESAAAILGESKRDTGSGTYVFTYDLKRDTQDPGVYPIVLVSYGMACTQYDSAEEADLVKGYLGYVVSDEGQQTAAEAAGSAPLSSDQRSLIQPAIDAIGGGAA
ncbi:MAG TPA: phosphate ABC transporter substrate-binding protein PstS [Capillimicrobium sp.]|nr:phosphate ABC transporter substrate-binding protein PstS [Capillimicrobium sp.]